MLERLAVSREAGWRPFRYFNLYRLLLASLALLLPLLPFGFVVSLHLTYSPRFTLTLAAYLAVTGGGLLAALRWPRRFNLQLSLQVFGDIAVVAVFMYASGGIGSNLGGSIATLMLVSLATASLVGHGRLVLLYAALATIATLGIQLFGILHRNFESGTIVQAGFLSAGFFATAILARLLGQRMMANEELARQRGISLDNQARINQRVIERMQDGILVVDADGRIQRHNPMVEEMLGGQPAPGMALADFCAPLAAAMRDWKKDEAKASADLAPRAGQQLRARFERTESSAGEVLVLLEDLGRIKERAEQLKLAALGRLTASIAHEIRNPLSAISHAGELLREERRGGEERLLGILADNVARLNRIVTDVVELGRRDRAQVEIVRLAEFCREFVGGFLSFRGLSPEAVVVDVAAGSSICFDRTHLHQVLWNLLDNAWRHGRQSSASVRLRVAYGRLPGLVELHVSDDGPGVPESDRGHIFEPFFTTHHAGTGLGLFIARELCEANGASLELVCEQAGGHFVLVGRNDTCQLPETTGVRAAS